MNKCVKNIMEYLSYFSNTWAFAYGLLTHALSSSMIDVRPMLFQSKSCLNVLRVEFPYNFSRSLE